MQKINNFMGGSLAASDVQTIGTYHAYMHSPNDPLIQLDRIHQVVQVRVKCKFQIHVRINYPSGAMMYMSGPLPSKANFAQITVEARYVPIPFRRLLVRRTYAQEESKDVC